MKPPIGRVGNQNVDFPPLNEPETKDDRMAKFTGQNLLTLFPGDLMKLVEFALKAEVFRDSKFTVDHIKQVDEFEFTLTLNFFGDDSKP